MIAQKNNKGFTLVELIVVITILAILGTIGFISLQGYSGQSRDSKRTSDLASLSKSVTIKTTEGVALSSFVTGVLAQQLATAPSVGGLVTVLGTSYYAGTPNYTVLGVPPANFKDPNGAEYVMGVTTRAGGAYQLAATLESGSTKTALVNGSYNPRTVASSNSTIFSPNVNIVSNTMTLPNTMAIGRFRVGDGIVVTSGLNWMVPAANVIQSISHDGLVLTMASDITVGPSLGGNISLGTVAPGTDDGVGLIKSVTATAVANGDTVNFPY